MTRLHLHAFGALLLALALTVAPRAQAERPLQTEDAGVLERGDCQAQTAFARLSDEGSRLRSGFAQLGCGVFHGTQWQLAAGRTTGDDARSDDLVFSGKTALIDLTDDKPGVVIAFGLQGGRASGQQGLRVVQSTVRAVASVPFGPWLAHANLGWARDREASSDSTTWNLALERTSAGPFDLMAEVYGDDHSPAWANAGARWWLLPKRLWVDASYGVQMSSTRARLATVGLSLLF
jgi:hypothetical protein